MKKILISLGVLFLCLESFAQIGVYNGKPRYAIEARRAGVPIGTVEVEMYPAIAPLHVRNFDSLVSEKFYDTTAFHRVIPGFMIQGGDPNSRKGPKSTWGQGNPNQKDIPAEFNPLAHVRGVFSAARSTDINSANSQFFICVATASHLDNQYTAYGKAVSGLNVVDNIVSSPRDGNDNPNEKIEMFVTRLADDVTEVDTAIVLLPSSNAIGITSNYLFQWEPVDGALIYELEFSKTPNFDVKEKIRVNKTSTTVSFLETGQVRYFWRILANNGGFKKAGSVRTFTTGVEAPMLTAPLDKEQLLDNIVNFKWDAVQGAETYKLQISTNTLFTSTAIRVNESGINTNEYSINTLDFNKTYFWRVASEIDATPGAYSLIRSFKTGKTTGVESNRMNELNIYPNPSSGVFNIDFPQVLNNNITMEISDLEGKIIQKVEGIKGSMEISFSLEKHSKGIYFYKAVSGNEIKRGKLVVN